MQVRLLLALLLFQLSALAQPAHIVVLRHQSYTSYFSTAWLIPVMVDYTLKSEDLACEDKSERTNKYKSDPLLKESTSLQRNYYNSGYDRGHNMSAANNGCDSTGMAECFYFSNMTPQPHPFNNGIWKELEGLERKQAAEFGELRIWVGSLDPLYKRIGTDKVCVPRYMYKVIYRPCDSTYTCYVFPNSPEATKPLTDYKITMKAFTKSSGVSFKKGEPVAKFIKTAVEPLQR